MEVAFVFGPGGANDDPIGTIDLYETNPHVRRTFDQVGEWTGIGIDYLRRVTDPPDGESLMRMNRISLASGMIGITDALNEVGIRPTVVGGLSLGSMVSACVAGAVTRRQLFDILFADKSCPASDSPERREGIALVHVPADIDPTWYDRQTDKGVFLGADFGPGPSGKDRVLMLSGYRRALEDLAADDNNVRVRPERMCSAAYHSPLRAYARTRMAAQLDQMHFADPAIPVCSSIDGTTLKTADDIRELFLRNNVEPVRCTAMVTEIASHAPRVGVAVGPSLRRGLVDFPFPVVHVDAPDNIADAVAVMAELESTSGPVRS